MDAQITLREGMSRALAKQVREQPPMIFPSQWMDRVSAAVNLGVGVRTVDRYIRRRLLTSYRGPVPGGGVGVRIWAADVESFPASAIVKVVG